PWLFAAAGHFAHGFGGGGAAPLGRAIGDHHVVNGLGAPAILNERELHFQFTRAVSFGILNCKLHGDWSVRLFLFRVGLFNIFRALSMWFPALGPLLGFANDDVIAIRAGNRAFDQQQVLGFAHLDDLQILGRAAYLAEVAGHFHAAHDGAWKQTLADGAGAAMPPLGAVRGVATTKRMPGDHTFKPAALGHANSVDIVARGKESRANHITGLDLF